MQQTYDIAKDSETLGTFTASGKLILPWTMSAALRVAVRRAAVASPRVVTVATNITRAYQAAAQSAARYVFDRRCRKSLESFIRIYIAFVNFLWLWLLLRN